MTNTLIDHSLETIPQSDIDATIHHSATIVSELEYDPNFQGFLVDTRTRLDHNDALAYWSTIGNYTETYLRDNESLSPLEKDSFALIANLPAAMTASYQLDKYSGDMSYKQKRSAKEVVCTYNRLVKHFITEYPQGSDPLKGDLLEALLTTIGAESHDFLKHSESTIDMRLRGMKHEIGFTQLLEEAGIPSREATIEEDLKGKDRVIEFNGHEIGVDVKASLSEIEAKHQGDSGKPYVVKPNGDIVMFSMLLDKHFDGGFQANKTHVASMADQVRSIVIASVMESIAK